MSALKILRENIEALMTARGWEKSPTAVLAASKMIGGALTNGTFGRIRQGKGSTKLEQLEELAKVFGVEPWQLLVPGLNCGDLPQASSKPPPVSWRDVAYKSAESLDIGKPKHPFKTFCEIVDRAHDLDQPAGAQPPPGGESSKKVESRHSRTASKSDH